MRLTELTAALGAEPEVGWGNVLVTGVCEDSRRVAPGDLFVAIPGTTLDGAAFAAAAVERGAVAAVAERPLELSVPTVVVSDARRALALVSARYFGDPTEHLHTIGVTGTNGKTTVCHWVAHLLGSNRCEMITTVENERRGIRAMTTPSSPDVQRVANGAVHAGKAHLIIEASSIGLAQRRLDAVSFDVAAFINLTHDHLDLHGDLPRYRAAKAALFAGLAPTAWAVVNRDDPHSEAMLAATRARAFTVARQRAADLTASDVVAGLDRCEFRLSHRTQICDVSLPAPGVHSVDNALVAVGVAVCSGLPLSVAVERLRGVPRIPGRGAVYRHPRGRTAIVDFAHNPDALQRILEELRPGFKRIVVVFGAPGESDRAKRPMMGRIAARLADRAILTADNPKGEPAETIIDEIARGLRDAGGDWEVCVDRAEAIARAVAQTGPGDLVLVAGKGHESYQIIEGEFVPHADGSVLRDLGFEPVGAADEGETFRREA